MLFVKGMPKSSEGIMIRWWLALDVNVGWPNNLLSIENLFKDQDLII